MPEASSHARTAFTGQATEPLTIAIVEPMLSWSVLLRRMHTRSPPPSQNSRSASSERRNAPAKPSKSSARSRSALTPRLRTVLTMAMIRSAVAGALRTGAAPSDRRIRRSESPQLGGRCCSAAHRVQPQPRGTPRPLRAPPAGRTARAARTIVRKPGSPRHRRTASGRAIPTGLRGDSVLGSPHRRWPGAECRIVAVIRRARRVR
jgi:hypothetical protein